MKIIKGGTRIVILRGAYAYKIAKVNPIKIALRIIFWPIVRRRMHKSFVRMIRDCIWNPIRSNRSEYAYWKETKDHRVVPTHRSFLFGMIIVQSAGRQVAIGDIEACDFLTKIPISVRINNDMQGPHQYVRCFDGVVRLADYGLERTQAVLRETSGFSAVCGVLTPASALA